jgi:hypothetical protein
MHGLLAIDFTRKEKWRSFMVGHIEVLGYSSVHCGELYSGEGSGRLQNTSHDFVVRCVSGQLKSA